MMVKVLPIKNCKECPYLERHTGLIRCDLSTAQSYEPEGEWMELLDQFCPLQNLQTIIIDSYDMGKQFKEHCDEIKKEVIESTKKKDDYRWDKTHEYLEKVEPRKDMEA